MRGTVAVEAFDRLDTLRGLLHRVLDLAATHDLVVLRSRRASERCGSLGALRDICTHCTLRQFSSRLLHRRSRPQTSLPSPTLVPFSSPPPTRKIGRRC